MATPQQYIGYDSIVSISKVSATRSAEGYPVTNLANPATNIKWKSDSTEEQYITVTNTLDGRPLDYIGIASHNLGSASCGIDIEVLEESGSSWYSILQFPYYPSDDKPILRIAPGTDSYGCSWNQDGGYFGCSWFQGFGENTYATWNQDADSYTGGFFDDPTADSYDTIIYDDPAADTYETYGRYAAIRLKLMPSADVRPEIGVLYIGLVMQLERSIYVGHTPITYGRDVAEVNGMAESGDFLGRIIRQTTYNSEVTMKNLTPIWYRNVFDPFVLACRSKPFFYAWRLNGYPAEVGYCWFAKSIPVPKNTGPRGMMSVSFQIGGQA
jgi:hypothetical protein